MTGIPILGTALDWTFLNEPVYRWIIFFIGASVFLFAWNEVLSLMK